MGPATRRHWIIMAALELCLVLTAACSNLQVFSLMPGDPQQGGVFPATQSLAFTPMPSTTLTFDLQADSRLIITFSALGTILPTGDGPPPAVPPLFIQCQLDGGPCAPGLNQSQTQFIFPLSNQLFCCDSRAYTWVVPRVSRGTHTIVMAGRFRPPTATVTAEIGDWSLVVEAVNP